MPLIVKAQNQHCGTSELMKASGNHNYYEQLYNTIGENKNKANETINIPVVVHVVYNTSNENIHDSLIFQQIEILNNDFNRWNADTVNTPAPFKNIAGAMDINFCLAKQTPNGQSTNGIVRVFTNKPYFSSPVSYAVQDAVKHDELGGSDAWDTDTYLNIWVCNLNGSTAYSAPPNNFLPSDEGIVCKYQHIGKTGVYPYGKGRSIVHEAGHYFGLRHIWGDDGGDCTGTDYIADTPNQGNYSTNCPDFPLTDSCSPNFPGVMFMNYMDYSDDGCRNMFTEGQITVMTNCINQFRSGFLTTTGCNDVVSLDEQITKSDLKISAPKNKIEISSSVVLKGNVTVYSFDGKKIVSTAIFNQTKKLSTQGWAKGIYIVVLQTDDVLNSTAQKILVQ